jgi:hypothetical protein
MFAVQHCTVGCASEQAIESANRIGNRLDRTYATIGDPTERLKSFLAQWCVESDPNIMSVQPTPRVCPLCGLAITKAAHRHCTCTKRKRKRKRKRSK